MCVCVCTYVFLSSFFLFGGKLMLFWKREREGERMWMTVAKNSITWLTCSNFISSSKSVCFFHCNKNMKDWYFPPENNEILILMMATTAKYIINRYWWYKYWQICCKPMTLRMKLTFKVIIVGIMIVKVIIITIMNNVPKTIFSHSFFLSSYLSSFSLYLFHLHHFSFLFYRVF